MADETTTSGGSENAQEAQANPVQPASQTQAQAPTHNAAQPPPFFQELRQSLDALPEKLALAVREAMPQPAPASQSQSKTETAKSESATEDTGKTQKAAQSGAQGSQGTTPAKRTFAEMWFGLPAGSTRRD